MGLLQALAIEALSGYFPGLDLDSLRVNILSGRVDLKDVDLTPGQIFASGGFPFRLTSGSIGKLGLHVPWASLYSAPVEVDAHNVEMHFTEISFPHSQQEVFEALRDANRRLKNRTLAESERAESAITRALQKFLPMLLDRVEANISNVKLYLHFANGETATLCLESFETSSEIVSNGSLAKNRADLEKTLTAKGISATLESQGTKVFTIEKTVLTLQLGLGDGVYKVDLVLPERVEICIELSLGKFVTALKKRASRWVVANEYGRPSQSVATDPRAWFKYATRAICCREGLTRSRLSMQQLREAIPSFIEYKRLHVRRLRKRDALQKCEEDRIAQLEDALDTDMILLLRSHARADVMAEDVSAFATKDWLSWALFDYRMSEERERLAAEIRKSLPMVDQTDHEKGEQLPASSSRNEVGSDLSRGWSKAKLSLLLKTVSVCLGNGVGEVGKLSLHALQFRAELDSSMRSYGFSMTLSDSFLSDGDRCIFHRGAVSNVEHVEADHGRSQYFLEAKLQKPALDNVITLTVRVAPFSLVLDSSRISEYAQVIKLSNALRDPFPECKNGRLAEPGNKSPRALDGSMSSGAVVAQKASISVVANLSVIEVLVIGGIVRTRGNLSSEGVLFFIWDCDLQIQNALDVPRLRASCSVTVTTCVSSPHPPHGQQESHGERGRGDAIVSVRVNRACEVSTTLTVDLNGCQSFTHVNRIDAFTTLSGINSVLATLSPILDLPWASSGRAFGEANDEAIQPKSPSPASHHQIDVTILMWNMRKSLDDWASSSAVVFTAAKFHIVWKLGVTVSVAVKDLNVQELKHGGHVHLSSTSRHPFGFSLERAGRPSETTTEYEMTSGTLSLLINPESTSEAIAMALQLRRAFEDRLLSRSHGTAIDGNTDTATHFQNVVKQGRTSLFIHAVKLECMSEGSHTLLSFQNAYMVSQPAVLSGSLDGLQLVDLSGLSELHRIAVKYVTSAVGTQLDRRAVSFNIAPNSTNFHLFSLEFTILRSFIDRVAGMITAFSRALETATGHREKECDEEKADQSCQEPSPQLPRTFSIQGTGLSFRFPLSPHEAEAICFEPSHMTMTITRDALAFSIRKLSVLTRTKAAGPVSISQGASEISSVAEWAVLVRGLDLDISHISKRTTRRTEFSRQRRSDWSIHILSRAAFFASPSQICLLQEIPRAFETSIASHKTALDTDGATTSMNLGESREAEFIPIFSTYEHLSTRVETQVISVELLNEDQNGVVISTIASVEIDPVRMSLRRAREDRGNEQETMVTRWNADSLSIRLEDRCLETPVRLREVIRSNDEADNIPESSSASAEIQPGKSFVSIEGIWRTDKQGGTKSSYEVKLRNVRIVPSPSLYGRVMLFVSQCSAGSQRGDENSSGASSAKVNGGPNEFLDARTNEAVVQPRTSANESRQDYDPYQMPSTKISLKLFDSAVQIFGKGRRIGDSSLLVHTGALKTTLLLTAGRVLLPGSQIRMQNVSVSMMWHPSATVRAELDLHADEVWSQSECEPSLSGQSSFPGDPHDSSRRYSTPLYRQSLSVPRERLRWNFFRQKNDTNSWEQVAFIRGGVLRLPALGSDRIVCVIPALSVYSPIRSMLKLMYLVSVLDLLPQLDDGSQVLLPPFHVSVHSFSVRLQVPTTADAAGGRLSRDQASIRIRMTVDVVMGRNLSGLTGILKVAADTVDEERGVRDQIISPCVLEVGAVFVEAISLSIVAQRLLRVVVSPLTAKVATGLLLSVSRQSSSRNGTNGKQITANKPFLDAEELRLSVCLRGVAVCCVAEEPRVQLLRLAFREIRILAVIPLVTHGKGNFECSLQDLMVEDTISWRFYGDETLEGDHVRWSNVFSGSRGHPIDAAISRLSVAPRLLRNSVRTLLLGNPNRDSSLPSSQSHEGNDTERSQRIQPLFVCAAYWDSPFDHVSAHLRMRGFELNVNMGVLPRLLDWVQSVKQGISAVQEAHNKQTMSSSSRRNQRTEGDARSHIGIDYLVIEPMEVTLSTKAPPRRIQETIPRRALMWLLGSETAVDITLQTPKVVFSGDFDSTDRLFNRVRSTYLSALASRHIGRQLVWQAPRISRLARVAVMSLLRQRQSASGNRSEATSSPPGWAPILAGRKTLGLREAMMDLPFGTSTHIRAVSVSAGAASSSENARHHISCNMTTGDTDRLIETLDITRKGAHQDSSREVVGKSLFRWLRRNDPRVPKNERFELYAPYSIDESLIVTSRYLLFISRTSQQIQEPIIDRSHIVEYHLTGQRITIVCVRAILAPIARSVARQQSRDTSSLARNVSEPPRISEIKMHEIECMSLEYASWLHTQLPNPNVMLKRYLG